MKKHVTKISLFILTGLLLFSCDTLKRVPNGKRLLMKNEIIVDNKATNDENVFYQLYQKPNSSILGYRLRLNLFNLAKQNPDSIYKAKFIKNPEKYYRKAKWLSKKQVNRLGHSFWYEGIHNFLKKTGEAPTILDTVSIRKSIKRLNYYYYKKGFFDVKTTYTTDTSKTKKVAIKYTVNRGKGYVIDTIKMNVLTPALDSLYNVRKNASIIKKGQQFDLDNINEEKKRITTDFRNNGVFYFQQNYISNPDVDTINTGKKANVFIEIKDQSIRVNDTARTQPFKIYKINKVNVFTDHSSAKYQIKVNDSVSYHGFDLYSEKKLKYKPRAITNAIFITKGSLYSDENTTLTSKYLSNLKVFNYPTIQYNQDPKDENGLIANIFLKPRDKYSFMASADFIHSTIQDFGISGNASVGIRNVFNGAETFEIGLRGNIGASKDNANPKNTFFNISEIGIDGKLNFPNILFPINTDRIIPKSMIPSTTLSAGYSNQTNIGLDKENLTGAFSYNWTPKKNTSARFDLLNIQFVRNLNTANYFNIYQSSYEQLNSLAIQYGADASFFDLDHKLIIENGTSGFINTVLGSSPSIFPSVADLKSIRSIEERRQRLTENNLIFASSFSYSKSNKKDIQDENFHAFKTKLESAGNMLSILARISKQLDNQSGANTFFQVQYSQYLKSELEYIKHWDLNHKRVLAMRSFFGIAVPYGNSNTVPFSRSYFAGGTNDIRAWQPYSLGPGSSGGINDFNEANMKFTLNTEFRFNITGTYNGALFTDIGNIWNIFDATVDETYIFKGLESIKSLAVGTGFGLRKDFGLFVVRGDLGFKTYNPAKDLSERWFRELNLSKSVINIGINYPF